jgi:hypothetical protein
MLRAAWPEIPPVPAMRGASKPFIMSKPPTPQENRLFDYLADERFATQEAAEHTHNASVVLAMEMDEHADGVEIRNELELLAECGALSGFEWADDNIAAWNSLSSTTQSWLWGHTRESGQHQYSEDLIVVHENGGEAIAVESTSALDALLVVLREGG